MIIIIIMTYENLTFNIKLISLYRIKIETFSNHNELLKSNTHEDIWNRVKVKLSQCLTKYHAVNTYPVLK